MTPLAELLGESPGIQAVRATVARLLARGAPGRRLPAILIEGETGTGKGHLARALHGAGPRAAGPLVEVNCAAIPETLLEAELFGFERGAFTDARQPKAGLFQTAHGGTLFLDEVGLLPERVQAKFLKVLEDRAVRRLGSTHSEPADVAIIAATSENLLDAVHGRRYREDLYHRLAVVIVRLPPLAERGSDILLLGEHFLAQACTEYGLPPKTLAADARAALLAYRWPGNVRELANVMERTALLTEASLVTADALELPGTPGSRGAPAGTPARTAATAPVGPEQVLEALRETDWNIARAGRYALVAGRYPFSGGGVAAAKISDSMTEQLLGRCRGSPGRGGGDPDGGPVAVGGRRERDQGLVLAARRRHPCIHLGREKAMTDAVGPRPGSACWPGHDSRRPDLGPAKWTDACGLGRRGDDAGQEREHPFMALRVGNGALPDPYYRRKMVDRGRIELPTPGFQSRDPAPCRSTSWKAILSRHRS